MDGRPVRAWGWNYRTLHGHLEMGQMDFEVWKWLDSGDVDFRTRRVFRHAASATRSCASGCTCSAAASR